MRPSYILLLGKERSHLRFLLLFLLFVFSAIRVSADTHFGNQHWSVIPFGVVFHSNGVDIDSNESLRNDLHFLCYDYDGTDDAMLWVNISVKLSGQKNFTHIMNWERKGDIRDKSENCVATQITANCGEIRFSHYENPNIKELWDAKFRHYYPFSWSGKEITYKIEGEWSIDFNRNNKAKFSYEKTVTAKAYSPTGVTSPALIQNPSNGDFLSYTQSGGGDSKDHDVIEILYTGNTQSHTGINTGNFIGDVKDNTISKINFQKNKTENSSVVAVKRKKFRNRYFYKHLATATHKGYPYPTINSSSTGIDAKQVSLTWTNQRLDVSETNSKIYIWRIKAPYTGNCTLLTASGLDRTATSYTDKTTDLEWGASYRYYIRTIPSVHKLSDYTSADTHNRAHLELLTKRDITLTRKKIEFKGFVATGSKSPVQVALDWSVEWPNSEVTESVTFEREEEIGIGANSAIIYGNRYTINLSKTATTFTNGTASTAAVGGKTMPGVDAVKLYRYRMRVKFQDMWYESAWKEISLGDVPRFTEYSVSKGSINDRIRLNWVVEDLLLIDEFVVLRRQFSETMDESVPFSTIYTTDAKVRNNSFEDLSVSPGLLYQYKVETRKKVPLGESSFKEVKAVTAKTEMGFTLPLGTISGRITYGSGTSVSGAVVSAVSNEQELKLYKSIDFGGGAAQIGRIKFKNENHACILNGFTFQAWISPASITSANNLCIYELDNEYRIEQSNGRVQVVFPKVSTQALLSAPIVAQLGQFFNITVAYDRAASLLRLYIDGELASSHTLTSGQSNALAHNASAGAALGSRLTGGNKFVGKMDEIRLWSRPLTKTEIENKLNCYLNGNEVGLVGYWPLDEGISGYAFDRSNSNGMYNEHTIEFTSTLSSDDVPTTEQLSIRGMTDDNGNYLIKAVPYRGEGTAYSIVPMLGVHQFEPAMQLRYIGMGNTIHNGTDFKDISSFEVKGTVTFEGTDYPVAGVNFLIDGLYASKENKLVTTGENGSYTIDVPIGYHTVQAVKQGHIFKDEGYILTVEGGERKQDYQQPKNYNFSDETKVTFVGRVAGGTIQAKHPLGVGESRANIGQATIKIQPVQAKAYRLNLNKVGEENRAFEAIRRKAGTEEEVIKSSAYVEPQSDVIIVTTDENTGEFFVRMPPISVMISSISTDLLNNDDFKVDNITRINFDVNQTLMDSIKNKQGVVLDTCRYHKSLNVSYRTPDITFEILSENPSGLFGDSVYVHIDEKTNVRTEIQLHRKNDDKWEYVYGYPSFIQADIYKLKIRAFEQYVHPTNPSGFAEFCYVPVQGGTVEFVNHLSRLSSPLADGVQTGETKPGSGLVVLNDIGEGTYLFRAGFPNLTGDNLLGLQASLIINENKFEWSNNATFKGYIFGDVPYGNNFITQGPDQVSFILRDPPGSNSSASMIAGTSYNVSHSYSAKAFEEFHERTVIKTGPKVTTSVGVGFAVINDIESKVDGTVGLDQELVHTANDSYSTQLTTTEEISTSDSPDFVGANGDVYVGNSTNLFFGETVRLGLEKNEIGDFTINKKDAFAANITQTTQFKYTQNHILNDLIPNIKRVIESVLETVPNVGDIPEFDQSLVVPRYVTQLKKSDPNFAAEGTYKVSLPSSFEKKISPDSIATLRSYIANWEQQIRQNEETKYRAFTDDAAKYKMINHSFDAGVNYQNSLELSYTTSSSETNEFKLVVVGGLQTGVKVNGVGIGLDFEAKLGGGFEHAEESSIQKTTEYAYTLADGDAGNSLSVSVYSPDFNKKNQEGGSVTDDLRNLGGPIFRLLGGATSCPHEKSEMSLFYKLNNNPVELSRETVPVEVPNLLVDNAIANDIPAGKEASFQLTLGNNTTTQTGSWFKLILDESSNPNGLVLSIDGTPLTSSGRLFRIDPNGSILKTLKAKQSKNDILTYENIILSLESQCDEDVKSEIKLNVQFAPSCTDFTFDISDRILNSETGVVLPIVIKDYDRSYQNFAGIQVHYRRSGDISWILAKEFVNNTDLMPKNAENELIGERLQINYLFSMDGIDDGTYVIRARTVCKSGNEDIHNELPPISIIKDMVKPVAMGTPSPANGILSPESEVSVTFNEAIQVEKLRDSNFSVAGVLNGYAVRHNVGLSFNGVTSAFTELPIYMQTSSFTIETWFKRSANDTEATLFRVGEGDNSIALKVTDTEIIIVKGKERLSETVLNDLSWRYIALSYDANTMKVNVHLFDQANNNVTLFDKKELTTPIELTGRLTVGSGLNGWMHGLALYSEARSKMDVQVERDIVKSGKELALAGYWSMDEGNGKLAADKVRNRHLTVNSAWFIDPTTRSINFNAADLSYVSIANTVPVLENENFSIEFWFQAPSSAKSMGLFSAGSGIKDLDIANKLSIAIDADGKLVLNAKGATHTLLNNPTLFNNDWHHFALTVTRGGTINAYVDNNLTYQGSAHLVGGMESSIHLGAIGYFDNTLTLHTENFLQGAMDEVRIWKSALTSGKIALDKNNRLTGSEMGLVAYFPFEKYVDNNGSMELSTTWANQVVESVDVAISNGATFGVNTPAVRDARPKEIIQDFTWTSNSNKIVVNISESVLNRAENCILEFALDRVFDNNSNRLTDAITWTAFINQNRLKWETPNVELVKEVLQATTFKAIITNNSGKYENWVLSNIPPWLTANKSAGTLNPLEKTEIIFTVDRATNVGTYEALIRLSGSMNIAEQLPVSLKVTGSNPGWSVDKNEFKYSMNLTAQLQINGVFQEDQEDIVAAFDSNGKCIGLGTPKYEPSLNAFFLFMNIYSNETNSQNDITFSLWDAGTGRIYPNLEIFNGAVLTSLKFADNDVQGTAIAPIRLNATDKIEQAIGYNTGWNWISVNIQATTPERSLIDQFKTSIAQSGIQLKNQSLFIDYSSSSNLWSGPLNQISNTSMYMLKTSTSGDLKFVGTMCKPADTPINLLKGWNFLGYVPQFIASTSEALAGLNAAHGDVIKDQTGFAQFIGGRWVGSLEYMRPNSGYMYNSAAATTFRYPSSYRSTPRFAKRVNSSVKNRWTTDCHKYQFSMTATVVVIDSDLELKDETVEVGAFVNNECRGSAKLVYEPIFDRYYGYLMVFGQNNDQITFKCALSDGKDYLLEETVSFVSNQIVGSVDSPMKLNSTSLKPEDSSIGRIYPTSVDQTLFYTYSTKKIQTIEILNANGVVSRLVAAPFDNQLDVSYLSSGIYFVRFTTNTGTEVHRFIKQ